MRSASTVSDVRGVRAICSLWRGLGNPTVKTGEMAGADLIWSTDCIWAKGRELRAVLSRATRMGGADCFLEFLGE